MYINFNMILLEKISKIKAAIPQRVLFYNSMVVAPNRMAPKDEEEI